MKNDLITLKDLIFEIKKVSGLRQTKKEIKKELEEREVTKLGWLKTFKDGDYEVVGTYSLSNRGDIDKMIYGIKMEYLLPASEKVVVGKAKFSDNMYFKADKAGILMDYMAKVDGDKITVYRLTSQAYRKYGL